MTISQEAAPGGKLRKFGGQYAFFLYLRVNEKNIVQGFQEALAPIKPEDIPTMIQNNVFPYVDPSKFGDAPGYEEYLQKISTQRLAEWFTMARPDLAEAILAQGAAGGMYFHKLRAHFLDMVSHPEKAYEQGGLLHQEPPKDMVKAVCDKCKQSWVVPRAEFFKIKECPFCHTPADSGEERPPAEPKP